MQSNIAHTMCTVPWIFFKFSFFRVSSYTVWSCKTFWKLTFCLLYLGLFNHDFFSTSSIFKLCIFHSLFPLNTCFFCLMFDPLFVVSLKSNHDTSLVLAAAEWSFHQPSIITTSANFYSPVSIFTFDCHFIVLCLIKCLDILIFTILLILIFTNIWDFFRSREITSLDIHVFIFPLLLQVQCFFNIAGCCSDLEWN